MLYKFHKFIELILTFLNRGKLIFFLISCLFVLGCGLYILSEKSNPLGTGEWPPPPPTTRYPFPKGYLQSLNQGKLKTIDEVKDYLVQMLSNQDLGYTDWTLYEVPHGFMILTKTERFNGNDGSNYSDGNVRWSWMPPGVNWKDSPGMIAFHVMEILGSAPVGDYRNLMFIVTSDVVSIQKADQSEYVTNLLQGGATSLDKSIGDLPLDDSYQLTLFLYEFRRFGKDGKREFIEPDKGSLTAQIQLQKIGFCLKKEGC